MINVKKKIIDEQLSQNSQKNKRKFVIEKLGEAVAETQRQRGLEVDGKMNKILMKSMISFYAYVRSEVSGPPGILLYYR